MREETYQGIGMNGKMVTCLKPSNTYFVQTDEARQIRGYYVA